jgi:NTP pyrophosphatase (non-canonical NTP hydrolase)
MEEGMSTKRTLSEIQTDQILWSEWNFGKHPAWHPLLGIQEEVGELAHAFLKRTQGIRKNQDHDAAIRDAVGDIVIYLMDFCSCEGIDLQEAVEEAWDTVRKRNWKADPTSGAVK